MNDDVRKKCSHLSIRFVDDADDRILIAARCADCGVLGTVDGFDWYFEPSNE